MFGKRLKSLRESRDLTQQELADKLGISVGTIGMYEIEKRLPNNKNRDKIASFFSVSPSYLFGESEVQRHISIDHSVAETIRIRVDYLINTHEVGLEHSVDLKNFTNVIDDKNGSFYLNYQTLLQISKFFDVSLDFLFGLTSDPNPGKDQNRPITIDDWPTFLAQLPEDQAMHFQGVEYSDEEKLEIMELAAEAKQKKLKKIRRFEEFTDDIIDEAYRFAKYQDEQRKKMDDEN